MDGIYYGARSCSAIIKHDYKILSTRRSYGEFENMWEFSFRKIEPYETNLQALIREIQEELEVDINIDQFVTKIKYAYSNFHLTMHCFICDIKSGELNLSVHNAAKWITEDEMNTHNWCQRMC